MAKELTIDDYIITDVNEYGKKFTDYLSLPEANIDDFVFDTKPRNEYSFPYGVATLGREVWGVRSKKLFESSVFPEGLPNRCTIEKPHDENKNFYLVIGHSPIHYHCDTFEQAKQIAANYLKALEFESEGLIVYRSFAHT
jgi:hypothetical protein